MAIAYRATGSKVSDATSPFSQVVALPAGLVANDIVILVISGGFGSTFSITSAGSITTWTQISGSPISCSNGQSAGIYWGRYSSGSTGPTCTSSVDHLVAATTAWSGCTTNGDPIHVVSTGSNIDNDTTLSAASGISSTIDNCMCILVATSEVDTNTAQFSGWANTSLTSIAGRTNYQSNAGNGGGFTLAEGLKGTAGTLGTWTATLANNSDKAWMIFALKPVISSASPSLSPSVSPSLSPSVSPSVSPSLSPSVSPSLSPSVSPSASPSISPSPSLSPSASPSLSPSPSPGYTGHTRGAEVTLPVNNNNLGTSYSAQDLSDVSAIDGIYVCQDASGVYAIHQFKDYAGGMSSCVLTWNGKTNTAPSSSNVFLQIYNINSTTWETVDFDNTTAADTDFALSASIPVLTNYKDGSSVITCRVYQQG